MFDKGDLVIHAQGSLFPQGRICGVVTNCLAGQQYRVFWYTTMSYQTLGGANLKAFDKSLT